MPFGRIVSGSGSGLPFGGLGGSFGPDSMSATAVNLLNDKDNFQVKKERIFFCDNMLQLAGERNRIKNSVTITLTKPMCFYVKVRKLGKSLIRSH